MFIFNKKIAHLINKASKTYRAIARNVRLQ